jgi:hypothetical protein
MAGSARPLYGMEVERGRVGWQADDDSAGIVTADAEEGP